MIEVYKTPPNTGFYGLHKHPVWEIMYYTENSGRLHLDKGNEILFSPGTLICVPPGVLHGSEAHTGAFVNICVNDPQFFPTNPYPRTTDGCIVARDTYEKDFLWLFSSIYRVKTDAGEHAEQRLRHLLTCVYDVLEESLRTPQEHSELVFRVKRHMQEHFSDPAYTVGAAVDASGYSANYMRKHFSEQCGVTPIQYLTELRLSNAKWLLEVYPSEMSIAEVAMRSGFADPLYFSRVFRKVYGVSPTEFRENRG